MTNMARAEALTRLEESIDQCRSLKGGSTDTQDFKVWHRNTSVALRYIFGEQSDHLEEFQNISYTPWVYVSGMTDADFRPPYEAGLNRAEAMLLSMHEEIEEFWKEDRKTESRDLAPETQRTGSGDRVFLVHGRDDGAKDSVARYLAELGLGVVVLHEQPNRGRTIIEKFEDYSDVGSAIVLCTGDDVGSLRGAEEDMESRARQNVIFEWGYFVGKLGRERVFALVAEGITRPSDYDGVIYVPFDASGAWRLLLGQEMRAAGLPIDLNQLGRR